MLCGESICLVYLSSTTWMMWVLFSSSVSSLQRTPPLHLLLFLFLHEWELVFLYSSFILRMCPFLPAARLIILEGSETSTSTSSTPPPPPCVQTPGRVHKPGNHLTKTNKSAQILSCNPNISCSRSTGTSSNHFESWERLRTMNHATCASFAQIPRALKQHIKTLKRSLHSWNKSVKCAWTRGGVGHIVASSGSTSPPRSSTPRAHVQLQTPQVHEAIKE